VAKKSSDKDSQGILVGPTALERLGKSVYYSLPKANSN
jgi:hypothetical protein